MLDISVTIRPGMRAPRHFIGEGAGADQLALEAFVGPCVVADATAAAGAAIYALTTANREVPA